MLLFGDLVTGTEVLKDAQKNRPDQTLPIDLNRSHLSVGIRNLLGIFINPFFPTQGAFGQDDFNVRNTPHNIYTVFPAIKSLDGTERVGHSDFKLHPEQTHNFDENLFKNCPKNVDLFGYYQSPKYFENIEDELRKDFKFSEEVLGECQNMFDTLELISSDFISLHIRRGDYVYNPNHPVQPIEYYEKALEQMPKDLPVIVFSDDSDWCKTHEFFESDRFRKIKH